MYGNFSSNFFKIELLQPISRFSFETRPSTLSVSAAFSAKFERVLQKTLKTLTNSAILVRNRVIYAQNPQIFEKCAVFSLNFEEKPYEVAVFSPFLAEIHEQKEFLQTLFEEILESLKYFQHGRGFYNPFETFVDKTREIVGWSGFSLEIKRFFHDFTAQIVPDSLIFHRKNCETLAREIQNSTKTAKIERLREIFCGNCVKARCENSFVFCRITDVFEEIDAETSENRLFFSISAENAPQLSKIPSKSCNLMGFFADSRVKTAFPHSISETHEKLQHFSKIISHNFRDIFSQWRVVLKPVSLSLKLNKLDCGTLQLRESAKTLNLLAYATETATFDANYQEIFEKPLLNFPELENWGFLLFRRDLKLGDRLLEYFHTIVTKQRYFAKKPRCVLVESEKIEDWLQKVQETLGFFQEKCEFLLVLMPESVDSQEFYREIKRFVTGRSAVPCQVIRAAVLRENLEKPAFFLRIFSQIAGKMGFAPWIVKNVSFREIPVLLIGIHASFLQETGIIAAVGSMNRDFSKYWSQFAVFREKSRFFQEMQKLVEKIVEKFEEIHRIPAKMLVIFRDGAYSEFWREERDFLNKNIQEFKRNKGISEEDALQLVYIRVKVATKVKVFAVESVNSQYRPNFYCPFFASVLKTCANSNKFLLFLQRNDQKNELVHPTKFEISLFSQENEERSRVFEEKYREIGENLQSLCVSLVFMNFTLSSRTACPAPLQNAFKLAQFLWIFEGGSAKIQEDRGIVYENLRSLADKGKLFYI